MCFSWEWIRDLLIAAVVIVAVISILKIIVGVVLPKLPASFAEAATVIGQILNVVIWAIVIIALIIFAFAMIGCLWSFVGAPLLRHSSLVLISHAVL